MRIFESEKATVEEIKWWSDNNELDLTPNFQRRSVWSDKARSFLIDTILRGKPIPKIYLRLLQNQKTATQIRQVVDGQQRLRTVVDFLEDGFLIDKVHYPELGSMYFSELEKKVQRDILNYPFTIDLLMDAPDAEVYDIFARLNRYPVKINAQEYRNSQFFGEFKTTAYKLANEFITFWLRNSIFTDKQIARMAEAELTADLLIAMSLGIKSRTKGILDKAFKDFDNVFPQRLNMMKRFREIMDLIAAIMQDTLKDSNFRRVPLFYTLFCAIYHMQYSLPGLNLKRVPIRRSDTPKIRVAIENAESVFEVDKSELSARERKFREATDVHTIHASNRLIRAKYVNQLILDAIQK